MSFRTERPIKPFGRATPSQQRAQTQRVKLEFARANRRYEMARLAVSAVGSLEAKRQTIVKAMREGVVPQGPIPSREHIRQLEIAWRDEGKRSVEDFFDAHRSGRPPVLLDRYMEERVEDVLQAGLDISARALTVELNMEAEERGRCPIAYHQVHRRYTEAGRFARVAARHGSRAAIIDSVPHGRVRTRHSHDTWALDELTLPVYGGMWASHLGRYVSVLHDLVLICDHRSTVPVGWYLADPSRRYDEEGRER